MVLFNMISIKGSPGMFILFAEVIINNRSFKICNKD